MAEKEKSPDAASADRTCEGVSMQLSKEAKATIIANNQKIAELLNANENLLRECGFNPPQENFALERSDKISFPSGYIRTVAYFESKYHLRAICRNAYTRQNIAYTLESSDLINYMLNRINIWGAVETIFYKLAIVNIVSVIEALLLEAANNICCNASSCKRTNKCSNHFSKDERQNARKAAEKLVLIGVLDFDENELARIQEIIDFRNRIHIRLATGSEMNLDDFTLQLYNEVIRYLQRIDEQIYKNAVPLYNCQTS